MGALERLLEAGAAIEAGYETKELTWNNGKDDIKFAVEIKKEMSAADWEAIYYGDTPEGERSYLVQKVSRMIRMDGKAVPLEKARTFKLTLLQVMAAAIVDVEVKPEKKD